MVEKFNETTKEGYVFMINIITDDNSRKDNKEKLDDLNKLRYKVYEILEILIGESADSIKEFLGHKESILHMY